MIIISKNCIVKGCPGRGQDHKWDWDRPTVREALRIEEILGIEIDDWASAVDGRGGTSTQRLNSLLMFVDMMHRRDEIVVPWEDVDLDPGNFEMKADPDLTEAGEPAEGKGPARTTRSPRPKAAGRAASTSGRSPRAASPRRSSTTPTASGAGTD